MRKNHKISDRLLQIESSFHIQRLLQIKLLHFQVCAISQNCSSKVISFPAKPSSLQNTDKPFSTNLKFRCSNQKPILSTEFKDRINNTHIDFDLIKPSSIARSIICRCSYLWENNNQTFNEKVSLNEVLLKLSDISPELVRQFWRVSNLKPENVLQILLGFQFDSGKPGIEAKKVKSLWKLFNWASEQSLGFEHLPQSYEIMASMLIRIGSLKEAQSILRTMISLGFSGCHEISCKILDGYVSSRDLENSVSVYNWLKSHGLVISELCYREFVDLLIQNNKTSLASRVFSDMVDLGFGTNSVGTNSFELVIKLLCKEGKIKEARNLFKKVKACGFEPSSIVINMIANGYCEKKDFEDLLNFLSEKTSPLDPSVCNKVLSFQCKNFGTEEAYLYMKDLKYLGFKPNEMTYGIFISWSCREGKLKDAFIYLSKLLSKNLEPDVYSYNAIISLLFKEGKWKYVSDVYAEMLERKIKPELSTFVVLLAGYCKFRRFDEVKEIMKDVVNDGLVKLSTLEDPLSKAFMIVGLDPSSTKLKRDNDASLWKTEFLDNLGNGLYLDTDIEEYEKTLLEVLEDAMIPDFNSLILEKCNNGDIKTAMKFKHKMVRRAQKLSLSAFSALVKEHFESRSRSDISTAFDLLEEMPDYVYQLDAVLLNSFIRAIVKKSVPYKGKILLEGMLQRDLFVENETFTSLFMRLCKKGYSKELHGFFELARKHKWSPSLKDSRSTVQYLCKQGMLKEVVDLFESMMETNYHLISDISIMILEELCDLGFTSIGHTVVNEVLRQGLTLHNIVYSHVIKGFCKEKRFHEAFAVLETMLKKEIKPRLDVSNLLIYHLCRLNKLEKAMNIKEMMLREEPKSSASVYNALVNGLCDRHQIEKAIIQFREIIVKRISLDEETYNTMIHAYCQYNDSRKVGELLSVVIRKNMSLSILSYRNLVGLVCSQGKLNQALILKEYMVREDKSQFLVIYNILIFYLLQTSNSSLVTSLLGKMNENGISPDEFTYNTLVYGYYKCQDFIRSANALDRMINKSLKPNHRSLTIMITHFCGQGKVDESLELSRVMELNGWIHGSVVQNEIVGTLLSRGRVDEAEKFLQRVEEKDLIPNTVNYDILVKEFCWRGRLKKAVELLNIMLKKGNQPCSTSYDAIIQSFGNCNQLDEALDLHAEMLSRNLKPSIKSWEVLVCGLCRDGATFEAEKLLDKMLLLSHTPSRIIYQSVIDRYSLENNLSKSSELLQKMQRSGYVPDFKTHWSLISNLSTSNKENNEGGGFLSKLLSLSGFSQKRSTNPKVG